MPIQIIDNFELNSARPIDNRFVVGSQSTYTHRDFIPWKYPGMRIWDLNDATPYVWTGTTYSSENSVAITSIAPATTNFVTKFGSTTQITNSIIFDNGTNVGVGTITPTYKLDVVGQIRAQAGFFGNGSGITQINASNITTGYLQLNLIQLTPGSNGSILSQNGSTAQWISQSSLVAGQASQLQTTKTIWGQPFNGTANVVGHLNLANGVNYGNILGGGKIEFGKFTNKATLEYNFNDVRTLVIPALTNASNTFAFLPQDQSFSGVNTFNNATFMNNNLLINSPITGAFPFMFSVKNSTLSSQSFMVGPGFSIFGPFGGTSFVGMIRSGNNSASTAPTYTWYNNSDLGIYRPANNIMGFVSSGSEKMRISTSGVYISSNLDALSSNYTAVPLTFVASGSGSFVATTTVLSTIATTYFWFGGPYTYLYLEVESAAGSNTFLSTDRKRSIGDASASLFGAVIVPAGCRVKIFISSSGGATGYYRKFGYA